MSIFQHLADPELFGPWFRDPKSWRAWRVVLKALFGDRMTASERKLFTQLTGRTKPPTKRVSESWWIVGRRGRAHGGADPLFLLEASDLTIPISRGP